MVHRLWFVGCFVVMLSLVGCQNDRVLLYVRDGTPTVEITEEPAAFTFTPTVVPSSTSMPTVVTPIPPTRTPTKVPLSETGPWLVYESTVGTDGFDIRKVLYIANGDGSGVHEISFMEEETIVRWEVHHQCLTVLREHFEGQYMLGVFELPNLTWILDIPLLSNAAITDFEVGGNIGKPIWSPTGCAFAFRAILESTYQQTYIFDCETEEIHPLRQEAVGSQPIAWSPDGQWLAYYRDDITHVFKALNGNDTYRGNVWLYNAVTDSHQSVPLNNSYEGYMVLWVTNGILLVLPLYSDVRSPGPIYAYNLESQQTTLLYDVDIQTITEGNVSNHIVANVYGMGTSCNGWVVLDTSTSHCMPLQIPSDHSVTWLEGLELWGAQDETEEWHFFNEKGEVVYRYAASPDMRSVAVSPDNRLVLFSSDSHTETSLLFTVVGNSVATLGGMQNVIWLDDGATLLATEYGATGLRLVRYREENNWQRDIIMDELPYNMEIATP